MIWLRALESQAERFRRQRTRLRYLLVACVVAFIAGVLFVW